MAALTQLDLKTLHGLGKGPKSKSDINLFTYLGKAVLYTGAVLAFRRHVRLSYLYRKKHEKWAYYFYSYEKITWNPKNCYILKNIASNSMLIYPFTIFSYQTLSFLIDLGHSELFPQDQEITPDISRVAFKSMIFAELFCPRTISIKIGFLLLGEGAYLYKVFLQNMLKTSM